MLIHSVFSYKWILFIETGHTQFRGHRYCPTSNPLSREEWLESKKREAAQTKANVKFSCFFIYLYLAHFSVIIGCSWLKRILDPRGSR